MRDGCGVYKNSRAGITSTSGVELHLASSTTVDSLSEILTSGE